MSKIKLITVMIAIFSFTACVAQKNDQKEIQKTITEFSKAGDENNVSDLEPLLDNNFRIVMNRLFGSKEVSIMPKSVYLEKIKSKEYGGDNRKVVIKEILVNGNSATAKVSLEGSKMTFVSLILLIKDEAGNWKLISDTPTIG